MSTQPTPLNSSANPNISGNKYEKHPAVGFINKLFKPDDRICIGLLHKDSRYSQKFLTAGEVVGRSCIEWMIRSNCHSSIFCSMNTFKQPDVRSKANVASVRTVYVDIDNDGPANRDKVLRSPLVPRPTYVLESSPNKFQFMWCLKEEMSIDEHETLLKAIANEFDGDLASTDVARILRVPGFVNRKPKYVGEPVVSIYSESDSKCTRDDFKVALPVPVINKNRRSVQNVYELIFEELGWEPLSERMGEEIQEGAFHGCPFHSHTSENNFGLIVDSPWLAHCLGEGHGDRNPNVKGRKTFDLVQALHAFDGMPETMRECAQRVCVEYSLDFKKLEEDANAAARQEDARIERQRVDDLIAKARDNATEESGKRSDVRANQTSDVPKVPLKPRLFEIAQRASDLSIAPVEWIIDGIFARGTVSIVCGSAGIGKGNLAFGSIAAILSGSDFLGQATMPVPAVVYVDLENPQSVVYDRLRRLGILDDPRLYIWGQWNNTMAPNTDIGSELYTECAEQAGPLFFFDSLVGFSAEADENDAAAMHAVMDKARKLAGKCAGIVIQHHAGKDTRQAFRGSTAIVAGADMAWGLSKKGKGGSLLFKTIKARLTEANQIEYLCTFDNDGLTLTPTVHRSSGRPAQDPTSRLKKALAVVMANPGITRSKLRKELRAAGFTSRETESMINESEPYCRIEVGGKGKATRMWGNRAPDESANNDAPVN